MLREQVMEYLLANVLDEIGDEFREAQAKHKSLNSAHEAYAVIREELDEFWDEVKKKREQRSKYAMRRELVQVAAMCVRTILDVGLTSE